jgi:hypothetical protein
MKVNVKLVSWIYSLGDHTTSRVKKRRTRRVEQKSLSCRPNKDDGFSRKNNLQLLCDTIV